MDNFVNQNLNSLAINAVRYALGRMSYVTEEVATAIKNEFDNLSVHTIKTIYRDIAKALEDNNVGMDMDKKIWKDLHLFIHIKGIQFLS